MSGTKQLRLLPAPKPLTERLGSTFFRCIPRAPGVYRMFDEAGLLLYVGQSTDLRARLNSYRHVHPDRDSRKTNRLVHLVRRIEWEVFDSAVSAVLRENELLRTLRPRFNRMNVYPKACFFVGVEREEGLLRLTLTRDTTINRRRVTFSSSRMLPGHASDWRTVSASGLMPGASTPNSMAYFFRKC